MLGLNLAGSGILYTENLIPCILFRLLMTFRHLDMIKMLKTGVKLSCSIQLSFAILYKSLWNLQF